MGESPSVIVTVNLTDLSRESTDFGAPIALFEPGWVPGEFAAVVVEQTIGSQLAMDGEPLSVAGSAVSILNFVDQAWPRSETHEILVIKSSNNAKSRVPLDLEDEAQTSALDWSSKPELAVLRTFTTNAHANGRVIWIDMSELTSPTVVSAARADLLATPLSDDAASVLVWNDDLQLFEWVRRAGRSVVPVFPSDPIRDADGLWSDGHQLLVERDGELLKFTGEWTRIGDNTRDLSSCDIRLNIVACVSQSLTSPPEVSAAVEDSVFQTISNVNAGQSIQNLVSTQKLNITNVFGRDSVAYLLRTASMPVEAPTVIATYNFGNKFSSRAQWIRNYPVLELIRSGIAVLLLNFSELDRAELGDVKLSIEDRHRALLKSPLSTVSAAILALHKEGLHPRKLGYMGWSWGGYVGLHLGLQEAPFSAVSAGEAATWGPVGYLTGTSEFREIVARIVGGPPDAAHFDSYVNIFPGLDGRVAAVPTLMEFGGFNAASLEYLGLYATNSSMVQAFVYPKSGHHLTSLDRAELSHARNLLWMQVFVGGKCVNSLEAHQAGLRYPLLPDKEFLACH